MWNNPKPWVPLYVDGSILTGLHDGNFNLSVKKIFTGFEIVSFNSTYCIRTEIPFMIRFDAL